MGREAGVAPRRRLGSGRAVHLRQGERKLVEQVGSALELLQGKWKVHLVFLMASGVHRHCKLLEGLEAASKKMMTDTLRALERDGLVSRRAYKQVPPKVEYSLTELGGSLCAPVQGLRAWAEQHIDVARAARESYDGERAYGPFLLTTATAVSALSANSPSTPSR